MNRIRNNLFHNQLLITLLVSGVLAFSLSFAANEVPYSQPQPAEPLYVPATPKTPDLPLINRIAEFNPQAIAQTAPVNESETPNPAETTKTDQLPEKSAIPPVTPELNRSLSAIRQQLQHR